MILANFKRRFLFTFHSQFKALESLGTVIFENRMSHGGRGDKSGKKMSHLIWMAPSCFDDAGSCWANTRAIITIAHDNINRRFLFSVSLSVTTNISLNRRLIRLSVIQLSVQHCFIERWQLAFLYKLHMQKKYLMKTWFHDPPCNFVI